MKPETSCTINDTPFSQHLFMAIELSNGKWQLGFTIGYGQQPRLRSLPGRGSESTCRGDPSGQSAIQSGRGCNGDELL